VDHPSEILKIQEFMVKEKWAIKSENYSHYDGAQSPKVISNTK